MRENMFTQTYHKGLDVRKFSSTKISTFTVSITLTNAKVNILEHNRLTAYSNCTHIIYACFFDFKYRVDMHVGLDWTCPLIILNTGFSQIELPVIIQ